MIKYILAAVLLLYWGCGPREDKKLSSADSVRIQLSKYADSVIKIERITYSPYIIKERQSFVSLAQEFEDSAAVIILALNKIDRSHIRLNDTLIVPDTIVYDWFDYSPFPLALNEASEIPKLLTISQEIQAFAAYEYGILVRWGPTSTGKRSTPTPNGLFHANWKAKETISTIDDEWLLKWSINIDNTGGISIHEYDMPGYPASHSCARLYARDANWLYYWVQQWILSENEKTILAYGTPVMIFGDYRFGGRRPQHNLLDNPEANKISEKTLGLILSDYKDTILFRQSNRIQILENLNSL